MFRKLFDPNNALMMTMGNITDCIFLSLFFLLGCLPVVTVGASFAALYDASFRAFRKGEKHSWQRFLSVYRANLKSAILPSIVFLVVCGVLAKVAIAAWNAAVYGNLPWLLFSAAAVVLVLLLGILNVLFPTLSRFENSFGNLLKNTLLLSLANLPRTMALGSLSSIAIFLCARFIFPVFFLPSLTALLCSLLLEPMFRPYMTDAPEDADE